MKRLLLTLFSVASLANAATKPNIIFILADDLGIGNIGCYGADNFQTPHIDKLASTGTRFTQCFTAALCGPSRALVLTGRYAFRNGSSNQDACKRMPKSELRLAKTLKAAGYATSAIGKWGQLPGEPEQAGFDDHLTFDGSGVYWNKKDGAPVSYHLNGKERKLGDGEYMPDLMHEHLLSFVKQHQAAPFFIYYSLSHVHGELQPTPDSAPESKDLFADNILYMDKLVGKLVTELETLKLRENTLLVFMGDNGTGGAWANQSTIGGRRLSGEKGSMLECGGLVPMIANWPGKTPAGKVSSDLIDSTDLLPTFTELAGGKLPEKIVFDGHSFAAQLRGMEGKKRDWVYNQLAAMWYVRDAGWKLNQRGELFDMSDEPFSEKAVAADSTDAVASAARTRLAAALAQLNPAGGILDTGDGTGRHANHKKAAKKGSKSVTNPESGALKPQPTAPPRPNVLFIAVDDLRPQLGCYGKTQVQSPNIDQLAAHGVLFNRAYCQYASCCPSRSSLLTGLRPDSTGVLNNNTHFRTKVPDVVTLPQQFKQQGYVTRSIGKIFHGSFETAYVGTKFHDPPSWSAPAWLGSPQYYFTPEGIEAARAVYARKHKMNGGSENAWKTEFVQALTTEAPDVPDSTLYDGQVTINAIKTLGELKAAPFFLAVGFAKPHLPFVAPKKYWDLYDRAKFDLPSPAAAPKDAPEVALPGWGELRGQYTDIPKEGPLSEAKTRELIHGYHACVSYVDAQIGLLLAELDRLGLRENTIIVLWGDHGWHLGELNHWAKKTAFELATRAPLILSAPGKKAVGANSDALVEFVDIYPTLCELAGLPLPSNLEGNSFVPLLDAPDTAWKSAAFSQVIGDGGSMGRTMRTDRYRLTLWFKTKTSDKTIAMELYDYLKDSNELENIAAHPENAKLVKQLTAKLQAGWQKATP